MSIEKFTEALDVVCMAGHQSAVVTDEARAAVFALYADALAAKVPVRVPHVSEVGCILANGVCIRDRCPNHAPPAQSGEVEAWRFVDKDGQPEPGCYVAIYEENGSLPVSLCHYGEWEFYDSDGDDERADDEGNVRGFGWSENAEDRGGDGYVHLRNVVAYLPTSYTYKDETMQKVRALLARREESK